MPDFKATMANDDVIHITRRWYDFWFLDWNSWRGMRMFRHKDTNKRVWLSERFTIKIEDE